ncbi:phage holin family protein [Acetonema longum]|uniref:Holin n=1 Tax=Acetonema longum DSM 6540 TaxID=1009370 RepID=F7NK46_9FIRM|nr:phage holin family protein [Acetonema longum]EGO63487.1 hypothetical protein ALO_12296 [Acetonema longum DSM 6540]
MDCVQKLIRMLKNGLENIMDFWPVKVLASALSSAFVFLFGGSEVIFAVVVVFVLLDTLTKWAAITKKYLLSIGVSAESINAWTIFWGFWSAWRPGFLTSTELRQRWSEKIFTYVVLVVCAGLVTKLPEIILFGTPVNRSISGGIYTVIALTELISITENLEQMGNTRLAQLKQIFATLANRVTGGNFNLPVPGSDKKEK